MAYDYSDRGAHKLFRPKDKDVPPDTELARGQLLKCPSEDEVNEMKKETLGKVKKSVKRRGRPAFAPKAVEVPPDEVDPFVDVGHGGVLCDPSAGAAASVVVAKAPPSPSSKSSSDYGRFDF